MARYDRVIPPGQEGLIHAVVETQKYRGKISKSITVRTNDPRHPAVALQLKADIQSWLDVLPQWQVALSAEQGKAAERELWIRDNDKSADFAVTGATSSNQHVTVEIERVEPGSASSTKGDYRVLLRLSPDAPSGKVSGTVTLNLQGARQPTVEVPLAGRVFGPIVFFPSRVVLQADSSGRPPRLRGTVVLQARPGTAPFRLEKFEADDPRIKLELLGENEPNRVQRLVVSWTDQKAAGTHAGIIRVRTDNARVEEIHVPYQVRIQVGEPAATGR